MRLRRKRFEDLLGSPQKPGPLPLGLVFQEYQLEGGEITPRVQEIKLEDGKTIKTDTGFLDEDRAEDENLFLSFVGLGARGNPSEKEILDWVHCYGLLWRTEGVLPWDERMDIEEFRREVLCACQMRVLYEAVQTGDPGVLKRLSASGMRGSWQFTLPTVIDRLREHYDLEDPNSALRNAWNLLREAMREQMGTGVSPTFMGLTDGLGFRQGWYCRDLHSAIYLSFYLFVTQGKPVRECEFCQKPMVLRRSDKKYCSVNCRVNAKNARDRQSLAPTLQR